MTITTEQIKSLREKTGAGMTACKNALTENNGDMEKAISFLQEKGLISAEKKLSRATKQGVITSYIHTGSKIGVLLELNCETDFVARRKEFLELAKTLAMQVAASPLVAYISIKDIPEELRQSEEKIESNREEIKDKPQQIKNIIIKARVEKNLKEYVLLEQPCIRDSEVTIENYIKKYVSLLGENIQVSRFTKFVLGNYS